MFADSKVEGFFGGINRTCPIYPAAGSEFQNCSQNDGRAELKVGAVLDTSDKAARVVTSLGGRRVNLPSQFVLSGLILDEESKGGKKLST